MDWRDVVTTILWVAVIVTFVYVICAAAYDEMQAEAEWFEQEERDEQE